MTGACVGMLCNDLIALILSFLSCRERLISTCRVCKAWHHASRHRMLWFTLCFTRELPLKDGSLASLFQHWLNTPETQQAVRTVHIQAWSRFTSWRAMSWLANVRVLDVAWPNNQWAKPVDLSAFPRLTSLSVHSECPTDFGGEVHGLSQLSSLTSLNWDVCFPKLCVWDIQSMQQLKHISDRSGVLRLHHASSLVNLHSLALSRETTDEDTLTLALSQPFAPSSTLSRLTLSCTLLSPLGFTPLSSLSHLTHITLNRGSLSCEAACALSALRHVRVLSLLGMRLCEPTGTLFQPLSTMPCLEELAVDCPQSTVQGVDACTRLHKLRVTAAAMDTSRLFAITNLQELQYHSPTEDMALLAQQLSDISMCRHLQHVDLSIKLNDSPHGLYALAPLHLLTRLRHLVLRLADSSVLTDQHVFDMCELSTLQSLSLLTPHNCSSRLTSSAHDMLRQMRLNSNITCDVKLPSVPSGACVQGQANHARGSRSCRTAVVPTRTQSGRLRFGYVAYAQTRRAVDSHPSLAAGYVGGGTSAYAY